MSAFRELRRRLIRRNPSFDPCLPRAAKLPPAGADWIDEIKHYGVRILAWCTSHGVRRLTRNGHDFTDRFAFSATAIKALPARSCNICSSEITAREDAMRKACSLMREGYVVSHVASPNGERVDIVDIRTWCSAHASN
jgi:ATP-dependent DNA ligase